MYLNSKVISVRSFHYWLCNPSRIWRSLIFLFCPITLFPSVLLKLLEDSLLFLWIMLVLLLSELSHFLLCLSCFLHLSSSHLVWFSGTSLSSIFLSCPVFYLYRLFIRINLNHHPLSGWIVHAFNQLLDQVRRYIPLKYSSAPMLPVS